MSNVTRPICVGKITTTKGDEMDHKFEFVVTGLTRQQSEALLDIILEIVVAMEGEMSGGVMEEQDGEEESE